MELSFFIIWTTSPLHTTTAEESSENIKKKPVRAFTAPLLMLNGVKLVVEAILEEFFAASLFCSSPRSWQHVEKAPIPSIGFLTDCISLENQGLSTDSSASYQLGTAAAWLPRVKKYYTIHLSTVVFSSSEKSPTTFEFGITPTSCCAVGSNRHLTHKWTTTAYQYLSSY